MSKITQFNKYANCWLRKLHNRSIALIELMPHIYVNNIFLDTNSEKKLYFLKPMSFGNLCL